MPFYEKFPKSYGEEIFYLQPSEIPISDTSLDMVDSAIDAAENGTTTETMDGGEE